MLGERPPLTEKKSKFVADTIHVYIDSRVRATFTGTLVKIGEIKGWLWETF